MISIEFGINSKRKNDHHASDNYLQKYILPIRYARPTKLHKISSVWVVMESGFASNKWCNIKLI